MTQRSTATLTDYETIDISEWCNGDASAIGGADGPPIGDRTLRGIPFAIPSDPGRCFLAFGDGWRRESLSIPLDGRRAHNVIFLHRLISSQLMDGGSTGEVIAVYEVGYTDGRRVDHPVRERFEIAFPWPWIRDQPALALSDQKHRLPPRLVGEFSKAGRRLTAVVEMPTTYYLWAWRNPEPDVPIRSVTITPMAGYFLIAGITLGHIDEHPLVPSPNRHIRIDVKDQAAANTPFELEVEVDRGYAGYAFPLPREAADEFIGSPLAGFGEEPINGGEAPEGRGPYIRLQPTSPAYAQVAASPSAMLTVRQGGKLLGQVKWSQLEEAGVVESPAARIQLLDSGRNWVRTTVRDTETEAQIPCRIHFRSVEGIPYQPHGHPDQVSSDIESWHFDIGGDVRLGRVGYAYTDGSCEGWLPRGKVLVDVARGFEYNPLRTIVEIEPGQRELVLNLKRWTDLNANNWFSGDTHVHFLSTIGSHLEAQAEGLNVINLLLTQAGSLYSGIEEFVGRPNVSQKGSTIVFAGQENRQHFLGHLSLLGLRAPVMPLSTGGSTEADLGGSLETTLADWSDRCRAQGGTVILPHMPVPNGEPSALIATGRVDAVEMCEHKMHFHREYYRYLNCGYRLPLVGGTDKMSAEVPVGLFRTYVYIPAEEGFSYAAWCNNLRRGRTFISSGPIIDFKVNGEEIGSTIRLPSRGGTVEVEAAAESIFPIHRLELVHNGTVVADTVDKTGGRRLRLRHSFKITANSWVAIRVGAADYENPLLFADAWSRGVMAHSSPIYIACGEEWSMFNRSGSQNMLTLIDISLAHIREMSMQYPPERIVHHHGFSDHQAFLERPFLEARDALVSRLNNSEV